MADKIKGGDKGFGAKVPDLRKRIASVNKLKEQAKEANGAAGAATKTAIDDLNVNKWAFTALAQAERKEPTEQIDRVLTYFAGALGLGLLDQADMFDDRLAYIRERLDALAEAKAPAPAGASNVAKLATAAH